jgi:hypothetical protein
MLRPHAFQSWQHETDDGRSASIPQMRLQTRQSYKGKFVGVQKDAYFDYLKKFAPL